MKYVVILIFGIGLLGLIGWRFLSMSRVQQDNFAKPDPVVTEKNPHSSHEEDIVLTKDTLSDAEAKTAEQQSSEDTDILRDVEVRYDVPFTSQAPHGQWSIPIFQDACEEASVLMAYAWTQGQSKLIPKDAEGNIRAMSDWEIKHFGYNVDLSPEDTAQMMKEYWKKDGVSVKEIVSKWDITDALYAGAVVIVPTNGKALENRFYTAGGPDRHMLVIIGYDPQREQFIINDPGTRYGAGYRYDEDVLYGAIRAYSTGDHAPISDNRKMMIVIQK